MKPIKLFFIILICICAVEVFSQSMSMPEPMKSEFIEASLGTWKSDPYDFMGMKMTDEVIHKMVLGGQFMEIDIKSISENGTKYEAVGYFNVTADGNASGWFFDNFGKDAITTYSGKISGNTAEVSGVNSMSSEKREIIIEGNKMTHNVIFDMKTPDGKDMPQQKITITYNKQN